MTLDRIAASIAAAATLALTIGGAAQAAVVYSNGSGDAGGGANLIANGYWVAQNFSLSQAVTLQSFTYNAYTRPDTVPVDNINLRIYSPNLGGPGLILFSGTFDAVNPVGTVTGSDGFYTFRDFTAALPNWALPAGNYYVGLNVTPQQTDMHWTILSQRTTPGGDGISLSGNPGTFGNYIYDHDFRFEGVTGLNTPVPEPATWAMMILGFGVAGAVMRRRRAPVATA